jgi:hypothetical protein
MKFAYILAFISAASADEAIISGMVPTAPDDTSSTRNESTPVPVVSSDASSVSITTLEPKTAVNESALVRAADNIDNENSVESVAVEMLAPESTDAVFINATEPAKEPMILKSAVPQESRTIVYAQNVVIVQPHQPRTTPTPTQTVSRTGMKRKIFLDAIRAGYVSYVQEKAKARKQTPYENHARR